MSQPFSKPPQEVARDLGVNSEVGLTDKEATQRLSRYGTNILVKKQETRFLEILREEITEPMILLLMAVGVLYSILGSLMDALTIIIIIMLLVFAEVWNEYRAKRSITSLRKLAPPTAQVIRGGRQNEVQTAFLVPGDVLLLKAGQRVPADARLLEAYGLEIDESSLTGESYPLAKDVTVTLPNGTQAINQNNMVFAGTIVTRGRAKALVTATGLDTELGRIFGIAKAAKEPKTALQIAMKQLSKSLVWLALFFSILIPVLSYIKRLQPNPGEAVLYGLSLAFVVIPEELPIIVTMVLGVGSYALSRKGAIIKKLKVAETLGNVTVIATDKTGTLTEKNMRLQNMYFDGKLSSSTEFNLNDLSALKTALLSSDAVPNIDPNAVLGNPMAQAILERLKQNNRDTQAITKGWLFKKEESFDVNRKVASYTYQYGSNQVTLFSGAPEEILENASNILLRGEESLLTDESKSEVSGVITRMAQSGWRLLGFGYRRVTDLSKPALERDLVFVGVVGFIDPPRPEVFGAIKACRVAGIRIIMVTGDHPQTAKAIASQVGIDSIAVLTGTDIARMPDTQLKEALKGTSVFARVNPEDKLRLVRLLIENGEIVAVTGDGINDAPALKEAHIGIAMGIRGTDVAKEASGMILTDDNFATIETAVGEGRRLFSNLRKGVRYYLACKVALVSIFLIPILLGVPLPFAPIQIIVLELFMDLAASATFVAEPAEAGSMKKPPTNPKEPFLSKSLLQSLFLGALSLCLAVTATYLFAYYTTQNPTYAHTIAFSTWIFGHIFLALNFRSEKEPLLKEGLLSNKVMLLWAFLAVGFLLVGALTPAIRTALQITSLGLADWALAIGVAIAATFWMEVQKIRKST